MAAHVVVVLDTTAPTLDVESELGESSLLTLSLATDDATEVRIWGAIDPTDPGNAFFGESEDAATWINFAEEIQLRVHPDGGYIFVRARDEVWNETQALRITVGTPPVPPVTPAPPVPVGPPVVRESRTVSSRSTVRLRSRTRVREDRPGHSRVNLESRTYVARSAAVTSRVQVRLDAEHRSTSRVGRTPVRLGSVTEIEKRSEGPGTEAALLELDIL